MLVVEAVELVVLIVELVVLDEELVLDIVVELVVVL